MNRVLKGNNGNLWFNGKLLADLTKVEIKVTGKFEEVEACGTYTTENEYVGFTIDGTIEANKVDSEVLMLVADAYKTGIMPELKIVSKLKDTASNKAERIAVKNVVVTEFMLAAFEAKALIKQSIPIKASDYEVLETI